MKVLLLGEFSSLHKYLKEGLIANGHQVQLISNGDNWKMIGGMDMKFPDRSGSSFIQTVRWLKNYESFIDRLPNYDVIQIINSTLIPAAIFTSCIKKIRSKCRCLSFVAAGSDYALVEKYREGFFDWYIYDYDEEDLKLFSPDTIKGRKKIRNGKMLEELADVIIPILYEYQVGFANLSKCWEVIPVPINTDMLIYKPNIVRDKIMIYHGVIREAVKGTPIIRQAMEKLKNNNSNEVDILIKGRMPFDEYTNVMEKTNILIDQCCGYGYGINACVGLAQGKIVLSCLRKETLLAFGLHESPIINIEPNVDYIYDRLEYLIQDKINYEERGRESRNYVENVHNYRKIAARYVEAWSSFM